MTRKHFIAIGDTVKELINRTLKDKAGNDVTRCFNDWQQKMIIHAMADTLAGVSTTFNKPRWIAYVKSEKLPPILAP